MRTELIHHTKMNKKLFDYYCEEKEWLKTYILKVDGKSVYKDYEALNDEEIQRFIKYHSQL
jgi:hypothetical protein